MFGSKTTLAMYSYEIPKKLSFVMFYFGFSLQRESNFIEFFYNLGGTWCFKFCVIKEMKSIVSSCCVIFRFLEHRLSRSYLRIQRRSTAVSMENSYLQFYYCYQNRQWNTCSLNSRPSMTWINELKRYKNNSSIVVRVQIRPLGLVSLLAGIIFYCQSTRKDI